MQLLRRYQDDLWGMIAELDEQIANPRLETARTGRSDGENKDGKSAADRVLLSGKRAKLQSDLVLFRRRLERRQGGRSMSLEDISSAQLWYVKYCRGSAGCLNFSLALQSMWQDVSFMHQHHYSNEDTQDRPNWTVRLGQLTRKMTSSTWLRSFIRQDGDPPHDDLPSDTTLVTPSQLSDSLDDVWALTRHELLAQGALESRRDHAAEAIRHNRKAHTIEPPADLDRIQGRYNFGHKFFTEEHEKHGDLAAAGSAARRAFVEANPDATPTEIAVHVIRDQSSANAKFAKVQPVFTKHRNIAVAAGVDEHELPAELAMDMTEFGGDVPGDGAVDSEGPGVGVWREQRRSETMPRIESWLEAMDRAQPIVRDDLSSQVPPKYATSSGLQGIGRIPGIREDDILPCESPSCIAALPGMRRRIERYRRQQGHA